MMLSTQFRLYHNLTVITYLSHKFIILMKTMTFFEAGYLISSSVLIY